MSWWGRAVRRRRDMPVWQEMLLILAVAFFLAVLVRTFLFQAFYIPSGSMSSTLNVGDRVLVNKIVYDFREPKRGEVVVFRGTSAWAPENTPDTDSSFFSRVGSGLGDLVGIGAPGKKDFVKRVVGLPGDTIACCDVAGRVTVNGKPLIEPYVTSDAPLDSPKGAPPCSTRPFAPVRVQPGSMFVMGDHRLISFDSRCQGQVPIDNIIGRAIAVVWSPGRWTSLGIPATFKVIPKPYAMGEVGPVPIQPDVRRAARSGQSGGIAGSVIMMAFALSARSSRSPRGRPRRLRA